MVAFIFVLKAILEDQLVFIEDSRQLGNHPFAIGVVKVTSPPVFL